jgi:3-hydroxybutyrate dehydrogenase
VQEQASDIVSPGEISKLKAPEIKNKVALVTGGGRGIGRAIALTLGDLGANLILIGRHQLPLNAVKEQLAHKEISCLTVVLDVGQPENLEAALVEAVGRLGPVDILVNNAGIYTSGSVAQGDVQNWQTTIGVNLNAAFHLSRLTVPGMIAKGWGRVINISSVSGKTGEAYGAAYSASKFGLLGLTESLALEVAQFGVTVNAVCPGWVLTDMAVSQLHDPNWCALNGIDPKESLEIHRLSVPTQRFIEVHEVADLVAFLCSNQGRGITGQSINICGGLSIR